MTPEQKAQIEAALEPICDFFKDELDLADSLQKDLMRYDDADEVDVSDMRISASHPLLYGDLRRAREALALLRSIKDEPSEELEDQAAELVSAIQGAYDLPDARAIAERYLIAAHNARQS